MRKLLIIPLLMLTLIACSEPDTPLNPVEPSLPEPEQSVTVAEQDLPDPEQQNTVVLQLVSGRVFFENQFSKEHNFILPSEKCEMIVPVGTPTEVYVVVQGQLTKLEMIFQKEIHQFIWCFLDGRVVLVNILDNQIRPVSDEKDEEHFAANNDEWLKLFDEFAKKHRENPKLDEPLPIARDGHINTLVQAKMSKKPFFLHETIESPGDKIEVVIKHKFTYNYKSRDGEHGERDMLFVDVKRNITRPHITFPQPLLP